jgi:hypothetical protein
MNYFQPYSLPADQTILAAWDSQLADIAEFPEFVTALAKQRELFPRFAETYTKLRALPRGTRRALQRKLARAREFIWLQPEWQRKLAGSLAGAALLLALAQSASAATINVTTNIPDINDGDGKCSLIEAIVNANNDAATHPDCVAGDGADTIVLPKGSIKLTKSYGPLFNFAALPTITSTIVIEGNGAKIARDAYSFPFTLIHVANSGDATLHDLTLQGGLSGAGNSGRLRIENSRITGNGFFGGYINGFTVRGRGIFNSGTLIISNSTISGNTTYGSVEHNFLGSGAGIWNYGGVAYIRESTISNNSANVGAGVSNGRGGTLIIQNSTISSNEVHTMRRRFTGEYIGANGGGVANNFGSYLRIENSTVSGNTANGGSGGGIISGGSMVVVSSTITNNSATGGGQDSIGGGVCSFGSLTLNRSIISGNTAENSSEIYAIGTVAADNFNLFGSKGDAGISGFTAGASDIVPKSGKVFGPLKNNGGPTRTHMPLRGSPVINAAPIDEDCPATDQRGKPRPLGKGCDIGAVESNGTTRQ